MALEIWWGSGSPYSWRALLALEYKQLSYVSHLVQFAKQEHKAPALLKMNPRGRVPVLKDDDYVCFESLAILHYLDRKYPRAAAVRPHGRGGRHDRARDLRVPVVRRRTHHAHHPGDPVPGRRRAHGGDRARDGLRRSRRPPRSSTAWRRPPGWSAKRSRPPTSWCFPASRCCCGAWSGARRRTCARASCRWRATSRRSPRGSAASQALPGYERTVPPHWKE